MDVEKERLSDDLMFRGVYLQKIPQAETNNKPKYAQRRYLKSASTPENVVISPEALPQEHPIQASEKMSDEMRSCP